MWGLVFTRINKIADAVPKTENFYLLGDPGSSVWLALVVVDRQGEGITEKRLPRSWWLR
jgi:hypothetical protein